MGRSVWLWLAKYADGVVLLGYVFGLAYLGFDLPIVADPTPRTVSRSTVVYLTTGAFLAVSIHLLYAGAYVLVNTHTAVEHDVKPVTTTFGGGYDDRLWRRAMNYETERGARRAGLLLLFFGFVGVPFSILGAIVVA